MWTSGGFSTYGVSTQKVGHSERGHGKLSILRDSSPQYQWMFLVFKLDDSSKRLRNSGLSTKCFVYVFFYYSAVAQKIFKRHDATCCICARTVQLLYCEVDQTRQTFWPS